MPRKAFQKDDVVEIRFDGKWFRTERVISVGRKYVWVKLSDSQARRRFTLEGLGVNSPRWVITVIGKAN